MRWPSEVGIREAIACELAAMGHEVSAFDPESGPGGELDVVLLYGPFGRWLPALRRLGEAGSRASGSRPVTVFWKTEGLPDPRLPWPLQRGVGALRSLVGRLDLAHAAGLDARLNRFGHLGDLLYAHARGWLDVAGLRSRCSRFPGQMPASRRRS
ncbi:MAG: hypothetical protein R3190_16280, partial [Thermoanaerobaculia bacterium]|nr:hypothetical protein [Thermoanaerobaculia bacterium]